MLALFRDLVRFGYNHGLTVAVLVFPYVCVVIAMRIFAAYWAQDQPIWTWLYFSVLLAMYPFYVGRLIKYLAWFAGPASEAPNELTINAQEWRRLFLVNLLVTALVSCGLLILLLPGIYLAARFAFADIITLLRGETPLQSLEKSWREAEPQVWPLFFGSLIIFSVFTLLELVLQPPSEAAPFARLLLTFAAEVTSVLQTLVFTTFFFRIYCLTTPRSS